MPVLQPSVTQYGKRCPLCNSGRITSDNSTPLNHTCLECGYQFPDSKAVVGEASKA